MPKKRVDKGKVAIGGASVRKCPSKYELGFMKIA